MYFLLFFLLIFPVASLVEGERSGWSSWIFATCVGAITSMSYFAFATWKKSQRIDDLDRAISSINSRLTELIASREERFGERVKETQGEVSVSKGAELVAAVAEKAGVPHAQIALYGAILGKELIKTAINSAKDYFTKPEELRTLDSWISKLEAEKDTLESEAAFLIFGTFLGSFVLFIVQMVAIL